MELPEARKQKRLALSAIDAEAEKIRLRSANSRMTIEQARAQAMTDNPALYDDYKRAHAAVAKHRSA